MFTGIIESIGEVAAVHLHGGNCELTIHSALASELRVDQSVAHNGVCLTVVDIFSNPVLMTTTGYRVTAVRETLERSTLGSLKKGDKVNLERCVRLGDRLDGHLVQGHVDATARCVEVEDRHGSWQFTFELPAEDRLLVEKGSICINGVSLTIASLGPATFGVAIIPYTFEHTTFHALRAGDRVNLEFDILGKYVARMLAR